LVGDWIALAGEEPHNSHASGFQAVLSVEWTFRSELSDMPSLFTILTYVRSIISVVKSQRLTGPISGMTNLLISRLTLSMVLNYPSELLAFTQNSRKSQAVSESILDFFRVFVFHFAKASISLSSSSRLVLPLMVLRLPPVGY